MLKTAKLAAVVAVTLMSAAAASAETAWVRFGVETYTRWGPGKIYPKEALIYGGTKVHVLRSSGAWTKVMVNGMRCWVRTAYLTPWGYDYSKH